MVRGGSHIPMMNPRDAPEKRPSVMSAVLPPKPAPMSAPVGPSIYTSVNISVLTSSLLFRKLELTHLRHARRALGAHVAEDNNGTLGDLALCEGGIEVDLAMQGIVCFNASTAIQMRGQLTCRRPSRCPRTGRLPYLSTSRQQFRGRGFHAGLLSVQSIQQFDLALSASPQQPD